MQKIIIVGNGIAAEILYGYLKYDDRYDLVTFSVDKKYINKDKLFDLEVEDLNEIKS